MNDVKVNKSILLSIVIPVSGMSGRMQNLEKTLISSMLANTEVILIHDIQDMNSQSEIKCLIDKFPDQNLQFTSGVWGNPGEARNVGLSKSSGKWVVFWDSDDIGYVPQVLEAIAKSRESTNFIVGQFEVVNYEDGSRVAKLSQTDNLLELALNPGLWRIAMRREFIKIVEFPPLKMAEDQVFIARLGMNDSNTQYTQLKFYSYVKNFPNQLTTKRSALTQIKFAIEFTRKIVIVNDSSNINIPAIMLIRQRLSYGKFLLKNSVRHFFQFAIKTLIDLASEPIAGSLKALKFVIARQIQSQASTKRDLTFIVLTGGLGNQLFQLSAALGLSRADVVVIDCVGRPRAQSGRADLFDFVLPVRASQHNCCKNLKVLNRLYNLHLSLGIKKRVFFSAPSVEFFFRCITNILFSIHLKQFVKIVVANGVGYDSAIQISGKNVLIGYFQSYKWCDSPDSLNEIKQLRLSTINVFSGNIEPKSDSNPLLVVHIRLGDYRFEKDFGTLGQKYYKEAIQLIRSTTDFRTLWLFSDEPDYAIELIPEEFRAQTVVIRDEGMSPAYTLELMRRGSAYIIANSSFSWWGARLSKDPAPIICAPKVWFAGAPEPRNIIHPSWYRV